MQSVNKLNKLVFIIPLASPLDFISQGLSVVSWFLFFKQVRQAFVYFAEGCIADKQLYELSFIKGKGFEGFFFIGKIQGYFLSVFNFGKRFYILHVPIGTFQISQDLVYIFPALITVLKSIN